MLCEKCKVHPASVFARKEEDGKVLEYYICSSCALERELSVKFGLFKNNQEFKKVCPCQTTFDEIAESGYVGCQKCYETFKEEIKPIIHSIHFKSTHHGKKKLSKLEMLTIQLEKAKENNFVLLAKKLEGEIKKLKGEIYDF